MTARPGNWSLITDDGLDPVAGDPAAVSSQAAYYANMAQTILVEAHRLASLGKDGDLVGKYAKSLQDELGDLAGEVHKAHKRYEAVGMALKPYSSALDDARTESWGALQDAEKAHSAQTSANAMPNPQASGSKPLTDAQKTQQKGRATAIGNANDALTAARTRLHNALTDLDNAGKKAASAINSGDDDALKDHHHWWDVVIKIIKVVVEIANYVAIVCAVVALFIPGLDLLDVALIASIAAWTTLGGDAVLFLTGNASLLDLVVDVVGVVTLGTGREAAELAESGIKTALKDGLRYAAKHPGEFVREASYQSERSLKAAARSVIKTAFKDGAKDLNAFDKLATGNAKLARSLKSFRAVQRVLPKTLRGVDEIDHYVKTARDMYYIGGTTLTLNTVLSPSNFGFVNDLKSYLPGYRAASKDYNDLKERL